MHLDALYNYARHMTGSTVEAEELVQETYARALGNEHNFVDGNLKAWLFKILRNTFLDGYRRRHHPAHTSSGGADLVDGAGDAPTLLDDSEMGLLRGVVGAEIEAALASVSPEARTIILLSTEGFTEPEMAEMLDCPAGTVKSRLSRARALLRARLTDYARSSHDR